MKQYKKVFFLTSVIIIIVFNYAEANVASTQPFNKSPAYLNSPIGDNSTCEIYHFITDYILKGKRYTSASLKSFISNQLVILKQGDKPHVANIVETEMSHLITILCHNFEGCVSITIYQRDGIAIISTKLPSTLSRPINKYDKIGFLGYKPWQAIGVRKFPDVKGHNYYSVIKAICYDSARKYTYLSNELVNSKYIIGYVRYIVKI